MQSKLKIVVISIITILLLYFIWRKYRLHKCLEKFEAEFPANKLYNQETIDREGHLGVVYLEFVYKEDPECSISRQFLSGCCAPILNTQYQGDTINSGPSASANILVGQDSKYHDSGDASKNFNEYKVNEKPVHATGTYDKVGSTKPRNNKVYKGMNYKSDNTCNPVTYYADEICNLSQESTLYHLKKVITEMNQQYETEIYSRIIDQQFNSYQNAYLEEEDAINYDTAVKDGILGIQALNNLYHFHIGIKLIPDTTGSENSYPVLKLQIPKLKENDKIEYETVTYTQNVNNIDQIMEFIYMNLVINVENIEDKETTIKQKLTLFDNYYNLDDEETIDLTENKTPFDIQKYSLYHDKRIFNFTLSKYTSPVVTGTKMPLTDIKTTNGNLRPNFIKEKYLSYKESLTIEPEKQPFNKIPKLNILHSRAEIRDAELYGEMEQKDNYLVTRPNMYWEDVSSITNDNFEDYTHIVILLEDVNLTEYYEGMNDKKIHNLVYWFAWNISKTEISIVKKKLPALLTDTEIFSQLYPYQLIKKKDNAFFMENEMFIRGFNVNNIKTQRHLNIKARIIPVTFNQNKKLNELYQTYLNRRYLDITLFYRNFFGVLREITINDNTKYLERHIDEPYQIPGVSLTLRKNFKIDLKLKINNWKDILNKQGEKWSRLFLIKNKDAIWDRNKNKFQSAGLILALWMYKDNIKDGEKMKEVIRISPRVGFPEDSNNFNKYGIIINKMLKQKHILVEKDGIYNFILEQTNNQNQNPNKLIFTVKYPGSPSFINLMDIENDISNMEDIIPKIQIFSIQDKNYYLKDFTINGLGKEGDASKPANELIEELKLLNPNAYRALQYQELSVPFQLETQKLKEDYSNYYSKPDIRDKNLTLFNYGGIKYHLQPNTAQIIHLPYEDYYEILVIDTVSKDKIPVSGIGPAPTSSISEKYGTNKYHEYLKNSDFTGIERDIQLYIDSNIPNFSPVDGDFTYRIPYKAKTIQVKSTQDVNIMIRLNPYFTQKFIWNRFMNSDIIQSQSPSEGLTLNTNNADGNNPAINIKLSRAANFMIHFRAEPIDAAAIPQPQPPKASSKEEGGIFTDLNITRSNESNQLFYTIVSINNPPIKELNFFLENGHHYRLFDGTITFLPFKFDIREYRLQQYLDLDSYGGARVKTSVMPYKMRCSRNRSKIVPHQILPTLEWKSDLPTEKLFYAVQASYLKNDGSEKTVYLAWDILPENRHHQYQIFPSYRKNRKYDFKNKNYKFNQLDLIQGYGGVDKKIPPDVFYQSPPESFYERNNDLRDVKLGREFVSIDGRDCEVVNDNNPKNMMSVDVSNLTISIPEIKEYASNKYEIIIDNDGIKKLKLTVNGNTEKIKVTDKELLELEEGKKKLLPIQRETNNFRDNFYVVKTGGNSKKIGSLLENEYNQNGNNKYKYTNGNHIILYNKNLGIWQIFLEENGVETWLANQAKQQNLLDKTTDWLFSPDFHHENYVGKYDFFDFPNQFNRDVKITPNVIDFTRKVKLSITGTGTNLPQYSYSYNCNADKSNISIRQAYTFVQNDKTKPINLCEDPAIIAKKFNYRYFNTTLFNIPNVSETDKDGKPINLDIDKLDVDEEGDMFMEIPMRIKIFAYKPNPSGPTDRDMSKAVRKHYLDSAVVDSIKKVLQKKITSLIDISTCSNDVYKYFIEEIQDEILAQRGDLDKVFFQEIFQEILNPPGGEKMLLNLSKFNSLDDIPNVVRNKKVIHDTKELSSSLIQLFENYTKDRLQPKNYYSYGNYELKQNETVVSYQVPVKQECLKIYQKNHFSVNRSKKILFLIQKSIFYKNSKLIKTHLDTMDDFNQLSDGSGNNKNYFENNTYHINESKRNNFSKEVLNLYSEEVTKYLEILNKLKSKFNDTPVIGKDIQKDLKDILTQDFTVYSLLSLDNTNPTDETVIINKTEINLGQDFTRDETQPAKCNPVDSVENTSHFLIRHIQLVSIAYFYSILDVELFNKEYTSAPTYLKDEEELLKDINRKIEQYNNYVGEIYKEVCEKEIKPTPMVASSEQVSTTSTSEYKDENDIYTYYKDMIFSIFDKEAQ